MDKSLRVCLTNVGDDNGVVEALPTVANEEPPEVWMVIVLPVLPA